jgi:hypothetical protein
MFSIGKHLRFNVDVIKWHFPLLGQFELDDAFHFRMDGLVFANYDVASRLPFEPSLTGDDVVGVHLLIAEHFHAALMK